MAVYRESPLCPKCGHPIDGIYQDQNDLPSHLRIIGDTFIRWNYEDHKCPEPKMKMTIKDESDQDFNG